ncbi:hypothetical protein ACGF12_14820 [Kitasatospora sp. NPDC048296]|uniref:hypothetical protein n=1 Tax=Kitasatospora sp. NPDC048296 TaxID=3364048 RepID=UPI0037133683
MTDTLTWLAEVHRACLEVLGRRFGPALPRTAVFVRALPAWYQRTNHGVVRALSEGSSRRSWPSPSVRVSSGTRN